MVPHGTALFTVNGSNRNTVKSLAVMGNDVMMMSLWGHDSK